MRKLFIAAFLILFTAGFALAQTWEFSVLGGYNRVGNPLLGSTSTSEPQDDDTTIDGGPGFGARLTVNTPGYYGHEIGYLRSRATFRTKLRGEDSVTTAEDRITIQHGFYNFLMYFMPKGEWWRPFITVGAQMHQYGRPDITGWADPRGSRNYGVNYGGGIKLRPAPHTLLRLDIRDYLGGKPYDLTFDDPAKAGGVLRNLETTIGLSVTF